MERVPVRGRPTQRRPWPEARLPCSRSGGGTGAWSIVFGGRKRTADLALKTEAARY